MFENVNLEEALMKERDVKRDSRKNETLREFKRLFEAEWENEKRVRQTISKGAVSSELPSARNLPADRIFEYDSIRKLCLDYRLRFLSTKQFRGEIPRHALQSIRETENKVGKPIDSFMIMAPAKMFKLEDVNSDPLLFAPLDDGRFYLIDKWGGDLSWFRKWTALPVKTPVHLLTAIVVLSAILTLMIPGTLLSFDQGYLSVMRLVAFCWNVIFLLGITSYFWFASHAKFSVHAWNSRHFN
jgi:hypothetical protein